MENVKALIGEQNFNAAFWTVVGSLVLSNIAFIIKFFLEVYWKNKKMRLDLNEAFRRIRILEKDKDSNEGE